MEDFRGSSIEKVENEKAKLWIKTDRAISSVKEVEIFLHDLKRAFKYLHLYKFLR